MVVLFRPARACVQKLLTTDEDCLGDQHLVTKFDGDLSCQFKIRVVLGDRL